MKHTLKIVFGKEQVLKVYNGEPLTTNELNINVKEYVFNELKEKEAFIKGINEAVGWTEYCFLEYKF